MGGQTSTYKEETVHETFQSIINWFSWPYCWGFQQHFKPLVVMEKASLLASVPLPNMNLMLRPISIPVMEVMEWYP